MALVSFGEPYKAVEWNACQSTRTTYWALWAPSGIICSGRGSFLHLVLRVGKRHLARLCFMTIQTESLLVFVRKKNAFVSEDRSGRRKQKKMGKCTTLPNFGFQLWKTKVQKCEGERWRLSLEPARRTIVGRTSNVSYVVSFYLSINGFVLTPDSYIPWFIGTAA